MLRSLTPFDALADGWLQRGKAGGSGIHGSSAANSQERRFRQTEAFPLEWTVSMAHRVTLIPGEGIGPEVSQAARRIIDAAGVSIEWEEVSPRPAEERAGTELPYAAVVESVRRNRAGLKGPMATAIAGGAPSINGGLRQALEVYATLRPVKNLDRKSTRLNSSH